MAYNQLLVEKKERIARERAWQSADGLAGRSVDRLPPGQHRVRDDQFPVLDLGIHPPFDPATWRFELSGELERPSAWSWDEFRALPTVTVTRDFHCVTTWSKYDVTWRGVSVGWLADEHGLMPSARHLIMHCADLGYTTNVPLEDALRDDVILAYELEGEPLPIEHGGPMRLIVPHLYGWKSAKWLRRLEFSAVDRPGFWEQRGYHNYGDPWREERFG